MLADDLPTLAVPTLLLWGSDDNFVDPAAVEPVVAGVPNARMEQVDGSGHLLTMERPETVAESIRSFLSQ